MSSGELAIILERMGRLEARMGAIETGLSELVGQAVANELERTLPAMLDGIIAANRMISDAKRYADLVRAGRTMGRSIALAICGTGSAAILAWLV